MGKRNKILRFFLRLFWWKRYILFESLPAFSDSPKKVYDEMLLRGLGKKYGFIWVNFKDSDVPENIANKCLVINPDKRFYYYRFIRYFCDACISSNLQVTIPSPAKKASNFYITHGSPIKDTRKYYVLNKAYDAVICSSEKLVKPIAYNVNCPEGKILGLGYPRNDDLLTSNLNIQKLLQTDAKKIVVWYPTFRQHNSMEWGIVGKNQVPLIHNREIALRLNDYVVEHDILLVLKPHFLQSVSIFKDMHFSNIRLIDDEFFVKNQITSYEFLGSCDALITDYSSVMFDFTLCDKPIALIWEDIDEYRSTQGILDGIEPYLECCHKIYTLGDMERFLNVVECGIDPLTDRRREVKLLVNASDKPDNTTRVTNFIIEQAKL